MYRVVAWRGVSCRSARRKEDGGEERAVHERCWSRQRVSVLTTVIGDAIGSGLNWYRIEHMQDVKNRGEKRDVNAKKGRERLGGSGRVAVRQVREARTEPYFQLMDGLGRR